MRGRRARYAYTATAGGWLETERIDHVRRSTRTYRAGSQRIVHSGEGSREHCRESRRRDLPACRNRSGSTPNHGQRPRPPRPETRERVTLYLPADKIYLFGAEGNSI